MPNFFFRAPRRWEQRTFAVSSLLSGCHPPPKEAWMKMCPCFFKSNVSFASCCSFFDGAGGPGFPQRTRSAPRHHGFWVLVALSRFGPDLAPHRWARPLVSNIWNICSHEERSQSVGTNESGRTCNSKFRCESCCVCLTNQKLTPDTYLTTGV